MHNEAVTMIGHLVQQGKLVTTLPSPASKETNVDPGANSLPLEMQGDTEMYSAEALREREALKSEPLIRNEIDLFWHLVTENFCRTSTETGLETWEHENVDTAVLQDRNLTKVSVEWWNLRLNFFGQEQYINVNQRLHHALVSALAVLRTEIRRMPVTRNTRKHSKALI